MKVEVRLYATLTRHLPPGTEGKSAVLDVPDGTTLAELIRQLGIVPEMAHLTLLNGVHQIDKDVPLHDGDVVAIFPPVAGGDEIHHFPTYPIRLPFPSRREAASIPATHAPVGTMLIPLKNVEIGG